MGATGCLDGGCVGGCAAGGRQRGEAEAHSQATGASAGDRGSAAAHVGTGGMATVIFDPRVARNVSSAWSAVRRIWAAGGSGTASCVSATTAACVVLQSARAVPGVAAGARADDILARAADASAANRLFGSCSGAVGARDKGARSIVARRAAGAPQSSRAGPGWGRAIWWGALATECAGKTTSARRRPP